MRIKYLISANRNGKKTTIGRKNAQNLTVKRKSHYPIETLISVVCTHSGYVHKKVFVFHKCIAAKYFPPHYCFYHKYAFPCLSSIVHRRR